MFPGAVDVSRHLTRDRKIEMRQIVDVHLRTRTNLKLLFAAKCICRFELLACCDGLSILNQA